MSTIAAGWGSEGLHWWPAYVRLYSSIVSMLGQRFQPWGACHITSLPSPRHGYAAGPASGWRHFESIQINLSEFFSCWYRHLSIIWGVMSGIAQLIGRGSVLPVLHLLTSDSSWIQQQRGSVVARTTGIVTRIAADDIYHIVKSQVSLMTSLQSNVRHCSLLIYNAYSM